MQQCFISHCSDDLEIIVKPLDKILNKYLSKEKFRIFCSSTSSNPLLPGGVVETELKQRLKESKCMLAIVTDNYLRSPISLTELSAKWFTGNSNEIIPIVYSSEGENYFKQAFISNLTYLNAADSSRSHINAELLVKSLKENGFKADNENAFTDELTDFFLNCKQNRPVRPFIGSGASYKNINVYCNNSGIKEITNGALSHDTVKNHLSGKTEIYFIMTTGSSFIDAFSKEYLPMQIADGASVYMIIPNKNSDFCRDVAFIENPEKNESNLERLSMEFDMVVKKLKFIIDEARKYAVTPNKIGHVFICAAYNMLRQTVCLGKGDNDESWGWITTTMPPLRASGNTPTIVFEGNINNNELLANSVYNHIISIIEVARNRNGLIDLNLNPGFLEFNNDSIADMGERIEIEKAWRKKYEKADNYMKKRRHLNNYVLIEIAAQHPLDGELPGEEFKARLDYGFQLYKNLTASGKAASIYVPGSKHMEHGIKDKISLSQAGKRYLMDLGISEECIFGEEENLEYMGENGVYNSCDECFVSASIFKDNGFGEFHCVCSPNQILRKQLFYLNFSVIPLIHTVPTTTMYHNLTDELFDSIPTVLYKYPNWSLPECPIFKNSRAQRMPGYKSEG